MSTLIPTMLSANSFSIVSKANPVSHDPSRKFDLFDECFAVHHGVDPELEPDLGVPGSTVLVGSGHGSLCQARNLTWFIVSIPAFVAVNSTFYRRAAAYS